MNIILVVCPTNFRSNQVRPQLHDNVHFEQRYCDAIRGFGVAMLIRGTWAGWIQAHHVSEMQARLLNPQTGTLSGSIIAIDNFYWVTGGGMCCHGTIQLYLEH